MSDTSELLQKLAIRDVIERYMRFNDNGDADAIAALFATDAVFQVFGNVVVGRDAIHAFFSRIFTMSLPRWPAPGSLFVQPRSVHISANPVIDIDGRDATAETDFQVIDRDANGRAVTSLVGRYRDRLRKGDDGEWLIRFRTGISVARPGDEGTDREWRRAIDRMPEAVRARLRLE